MERTLTEWEREQARWSWFRRLLDGNPVIRPPTLADLMADPGELDVSCLDCHHNTTMPMAALLPRYAAETPFPDIWDGFRCFGLWGRHVDVRPYWAARQAAGQITPSEGAI